MFNELIFWVWFSVIWFVLGVAAAVPCHVRKCRRDVVNVMTEISPSYELINTFEVEHRPAAKLLKEQGYLPVILLVKNVVSGAYHAARLPIHPRPISHCIYRRVLDPLAFSLQPYSKTFPFFSPEPVVTSKKT